MANETAPQVVVFVGSKSDLVFLKSSKLDNVFGRVGVTYEIIVASADRNSIELRQICCDMAAQGTKVFIGIAGMAAILPSAIAANIGFSLPVIGVPKASEPFGVQDAMLSIISKPNGAPVLFCNTPFNAALAACQILAVGYKEIAESYVGFLNALAAEKPVVRNVSLSEVK